MGAILLIFAMFLATSALLVLAFLVWAFFLYTDLVKRKNRLTEKWADLRFFLKRRASLLPEFLIAVKMLDFPKNIIVKRVKDVWARLDETNMSTRFYSERNLTHALNELLAATEEHPAYRSNKDYTCYKQELTELTYFIQNAHRRYNDNVQQYNNRITKFPFAFIARLYLFKPAEYFGPGPSESRPDAYEYHSQGEKKPWPSDRLISNLPD